MVVASRPGASEAVARRAKDEAAAKAYRVAGDVKVGLAIGHVDIDPWAGGPSGDFLVRPVLAQEDGTFAYLSDRAPRFPDAFSAPDATPLRMHVDTTASHFRAPGNAGAFTLAEERAAAPAFVVSLAAARGFRALGWRALGGADVSSAGYDGFALLLDRVGFGGDAVARAATRQRAAPARDPSTCDPIRRGGGIIRYTLHGFSDQSSTQSVMSQRSQRVSCTPY